MSGKHRSNFPGVKSTIVKPKQIIDGIATYVKIPDGGSGLDVGCGSGALTIACAKRNPNASFIGIDRWGKEYASFNKTLCEKR